MKEREREIGETRKEPWRLWMGGLKKGYRPIQKERDNRRTIGEVVRGGQSIVILVPASFQIFHDAERVAEGDVEADEVILGKQG